MSVIWRATVFAAILGLAFTSDVMTDRTQARGSAIFEERSVNVLNWNDYIDEAVLEQFTDETGIRVIYDIFNTDQALTGLLQQGQSGYDIVVPSSEFLARHIEAGYLQKLDKSKLPNLQNMSPLITDQLKAFDPENAYSINYMWGTTGIGYNPAKVIERLGEDPPVDDWALIFDIENIKKLSQCGVHVIDASSELIPAALKYLGLKPTSENADDLEEAETLLTAISPYIEAYQSTNYIRLLASGDICVAVGFSGDMFQASALAAKRGSDIEVVYSIPKQGAQIWFDQMAIPSDAPNVEEAHIFLNFIMRPDVIARASNYVYYANGNEASWTMLEEELFNDPSIFPTSELKKSLFTKPPYQSATQERVDAMWARIKAVEKALP